MNHAFEARTPQQEEVFQTLRRFSEEKRFHRYFDGALEALRGSNPDRFSQAAHSIREILDQLPSILGVERVRYAKGFIDEAAKAMRNISAEEIASGEITPEIQKVLRSLKKAEKHSDGISRYERILVAFQKRERGSTPFANERVRAFIRLGEYFQNIAHHNRETGESEFRENLERFENLLLLFLGDRTDEVHRELIGLLKSEPTDEARERVEFLISNSASSYATMLRHLTRADWLPVISALGVFSKIEEPYEISDGEIAFPVVRSTSVLLNIVEDDPEPCLEILQDFPFEKNYRSIGPSVACLSKVSDGALKTKVFGLAGKLIKLNLWEFLERADEFFEHWISKGCLNEVSETLNLLFNELIAQEEARDYFHQSYWQLGSIGKRTFSRLLGADPRVLEDLVFDLILVWRANQAAGNSKNSTLGQDAKRLLGEQFVDTSEYFRFRTFEAGRETIPALLSNQIFLLGCHYVELHDVAEFFRFDKRLRSEPWDLFHRIRWELYARSPEKTLSLARADVLDRFSYFSFAAFYHRESFADMLFQHVKIHGSDFLSKSEISMLFEKVLEGPLDENESDSFSHGTEDRVKSREFHLRQLRPFRDLLPEALRSQYETWAAENRKYNEKDYRDRRNFEVYSIHEVSFYTKEELGKLENEEILRVLNQWDSEEARQDDRFDFQHRPSMRALATEFARLYFDNPDRFSRWGNWWENIVHPTVIGVFLEEASKLVAPAKSENQSFSELPHDFENWFEIAEFSWKKAVESMESTASPEQGEEEGDHNWHFRPAISFLGSFWGSQRNFSTETVTRAADQLAKLLLFLPGKSDGEWTASPRCYIGEAINADQGIATESLLLSIWKLNSNNAKPEHLRRYFDPIFALVSATPVSMLVQAIIGRRFDLFVWLLGELGIEFPPSPLFAEELDPEQCKPFVISFWEDAKVSSQVISQCPGVFAAGLHILEGLQTEPTSQEYSEMRDQFAKRLGFKLAFCEWNDLLPESEDGRQYLDEFFRKADAGARRDTISAIGSSMRDLTADDFVEFESSLKRTMAIADARIAKIGKRMPSDAKYKVEVQSELHALLQWFCCSCLPIFWRQKLAENVIDLLEVTRHIYRFIDQLDEDAENSDKLHRSLKILELYIEKGEDDVLYSLSNEPIVPLLLKGLSSSDNESALISRQIKDFLFRAGVGQSLDFEA